MQAMTLSQYGSSEHFTLSEIAQPEVKPGHILVSIAATSVNPVDYKIRTAGEDLPFAPALPAVLGMDFAGTVDAVGEGVTDFAVGDEVYGCAGGLADLPGTLAEYMVADARLMAHKPKTLSMAEAAALPLVSITAFEGLTRAGVSAGQKVLVHGGSGGVGHIATQLAKQLGAEVYATGGGDKQLQLIESFGATGINYKTQAVDEYVEQHTAGKGFDVIYDTVGDANLLNSFQAIALNGQIATTSTMSEIDLTLAHIKGASMHIVFMLLPMLHNVGRERHGEILKQVASIVDAGELKPVLTEQQFTLAETAAAHDYAESGQGMGKVVITIF
ncbi:zinc-dependent alcohol dehydrogenase family protein [Gilvimarinus agarilyticus]|uniref:zinc-dependent alcohol dehydrogenase family protein n=1 Tax=Gilvimarinus sp. 2_MG-2023 TaxID=3062666 RepID=UPI001C0855BF|nr:zinc-dependent alcohol dehydrogenase family protein [Gilvimarinus sp. 2_MG-2023]MBU2884592.1 zinc-dependent alcohol dehydrogenase family protein [Gilvimarinus agarilyticus]MDO6569701.1 zinc-dependent alcohol dehydrogenase family protein [Gilvimarinus sp. 2_MG-2023]